MNPKLLLVLGAVPVLYNVSVSPKGLAVSKPANSSGQSYEFVVLGLNSGQGYSREILCTGQVTNCSSTTPSSFVPNSYGMNITVTFMTLAPGTGRVRLKVWGGGSPSSTDSGWINVTVAPPYAVAVTPDNGSAPIRVANTGPYSEQFTITNTGSSPNSYTFVCTGVNGVTCGTVPPPTGQIAANGSVIVSMPYSVGNPNTGTLTLRANGSSGSTDVGSYSVPIVRYGLTVATYLGATVTPTRFELTGPHSESFVVTNTGSGSNTFSFSCSSTGPVSCGTPPGNVALNASASATVSMLYNVGAAGNGSLTLTASGTNATGFASYGVPVAVNLSKVSDGVLTFYGPMLLQETVNTYDLAGRPTQITDARGKVARYDYGGNPNAAFLTKVTRETDGTGIVNLVTDLAYSVGQLDSIRDEGGSWRRFTYDGFGRLRQIKNHARVTIRAYGYAFSRAEPNWTFDATRPNAVVDTTFMQQALLQAVISTQYADGLGRPIQTVVQEGVSGSPTYHVKATQYDLMGREWRVWNPYRRPNAGYDAAFIATATDSANSYFGASLAKPFTEIQYRPDALQRVSKRIPAYIGSSPSIWSITAYGTDPAPGARQRIVEQVDESGKRNRLYADVFGFEVKSVLGVATPEESNTSFLYNIIGKRTQVTDPRGLLSTLSVNTRGLATAKTTPDAGTVRYLYDAAGNMRYSQDAKQSDGDSVHFMTYDFAERALTSGVGPADFATLNPDATSAPALETTTSNWLVVRKYDARPSTGPGDFPWNLFAPEINGTPLANVTGRLAAVASKSNGSWQVTLFSYDTDGQEAARYTYTHRSGTTAVLTALNTTITYVRDLRGVLTERRLTIGANTFNHWYEYDGRGLLFKAFASTSTQPTSPDVTYTYRPDGQVQSRLFLGGPTIPFRYTIRQQLDSIGSPGDSIAPFSARYAYHPNGTVAEAEFYNPGSPAAHKRYKYSFPSYDGLNRMLAATYSGRTSSGWVSTGAYNLSGIVYDRSGNLQFLKRQREDGNLIDDLTYGIASSSNRLTSISDAVGLSGESWDAETGSFDYDLNGNITSAPAPFSIGSVIYDARNLPLSIGTSQGTASFRYNQAGQRIAKTSPSSGNVELYVMDGSTTLSVVTVQSNGVVLSWYFNVTTGTQVIGRQLNSGSRRYYHTDLLGSTRAVVQGTTVLESYDFDPWGLLMPGRTLGSGTKEGFTGKELDTETALSYFGARYYVAALGRWISIDPMAAKHPGWSPYNYTRNNPNSLIDPDGNDIIPVDGGWKFTGADAEMLFRQLQLTFRYIEPNRRQSANVSQIVNAILNHFLEEKISLWGLRYTNGPLGGQGGKVGPFGGTEGVRYVYTLEFGWLDMAHFFQAAAFAQLNIGGGWRKMAAQTGLGFSHATDKLWEKTEQLENEQGDWSYEDAPSNYAGLIFFVYYYTTDENLVNDLTRFLDRVKAVEPQQAPNWQQMQPDDQRGVRWFEQNKSFKPVLNPKRVTQPPQ